MSKRSKPFVTISVRIPQQLRTRLERLARQANRSQSSFIHLMLEAAVQAESQAVKETTRVRLN